MKKLSLLRRSEVVGIIALFICAGIAPVISGYSGETNRIDTDVCESQERVVVTCRTFGIPGRSFREVEMPYSEVERLFDKINDLAVEIARDPLSGEIEHLQQGVISLADDHELLPREISVETLQPRFFSFLDKQFPQVGVSPFLNQNRAFAPFCNFATTGSGSQFPIIILPRLIPILLTPIPRAFLHWSATEGYTSCGSMLTGEGFIAYGMQRGTALGFWGIGFSVFLPPVRAYGFIGYALFATCTAEAIEPWPPNYPPEVSAVSPLDGAVDVPVSTSELRFQIGDFNGDKMSYSVTTYPDIGSGSGSNKNDGVYSVPISGLEGSEEYTWNVEVSDGEEVVDVSFMFSTEPVAPMVSDPSPPDGARNVPVPLTKLSFYLKDPQGDSMDYTVETVPNIGSGSGSGVGDGTYAVDVSGLDYSQEYKWFVNVTDGVNWKHKVFSFKTRPLTGPWWNDSWPYRKEIVVNYAKVDGDFDNFPILIKLESDADLASKAQSDGDDIVFTGYYGLKLNHEIEFYNSIDGELIAWVNVQSLTPDSILYMYYGNLNCSNQQNVEGTWDSYFVMVQHMKDDYDNSHVMDSTTNDNDGTKKESNEPAETDGKIGKSQHFDGDDYIDVSTDPTLDITGDITVQCWIKTSSFDEVILDKTRTSPTPITGYRMASNSHNNVGFAVWNGDGKWAGGGSISDGDWHHIVGTYEQSTTTIKWYKDGYNEVTETGAPTSIGTNSLPFCIGSTSAHGPDRINGYIDEVRISNTNRNGEWISTEYNNQNDPSSFMSFSLEETGP